MTLLVAWMRDDESFVCCDSARSVTGRSPELPDSSFGQRQDVDGNAVEEGVLKMASVAGGVALIAGSPDAAVNFCQRLTTLDPSDLLQRMERLAPIFIGTQPEFSIVVPLSIDGRAALMRFSTRDGGCVCIAPNAIIDGSAQKPLRLQVELALAAIVNNRATHRITAEEEQVAMLCFLQLLSTFEDLPAQGIGGAFVGARVGRAVKWQPSISYSSAIRTHVQVLLSLHIPRQLQSKKRSAEYGAASMTGLASCRRRSSKRRCCFDRQPTIVRGTLLRRLLHEG